MTLALFVRFALAIVCDAGAFIVWDVGTRPPVQLFRDIVHGARRPRGLAWGLARFVLGAGLLSLAAVVARPGMPSVRAFMLIETGMLIAALLVENLVGPDIRGTARRSSA